VTVLLRQLDRSFATLSLRVNAHLLRQEIEEDVDMARDRRHVQIGEIRGIFLRAVDSPLDKQLDGVVATVLDSESHQLMGVTVVAIIKYIYTIVSIGLKVAK